MISRTGIRRPARRPEYRWFWSITVHVDPKLVMNTSGRAATLRRGQGTIPAELAEVTAAAEEGPLSRVSYLNGSVLRLATVGPPCATRLQPNQRQSTQLRKLQATSTCLQIIVSTCFALVPPRADAPTRRATSGPGLATSTISDVGCRMTDFPTPRICAPLPLAWLKIGFCRRCGSFTR